MDGAGPFFLHAGHVTMWVNLDTMMYEGMEVLF